MNRKALVALAMATAFGVLGTASTIAKDDMGGGSDRGDRTAIGAIAASRAGLWCRAV